MSNPANFGDPTLPERFWSKVERSPDGCWLWTGSINQHGYGRDGKRLAHRVVWEALRGPVANGLELDHLCKARRCVNPEHIEAVTHAENLHRSDTAWAVARRNGTCVSGRHSKPRPGPCLPCLYERRAERKDEIREIRRKWREKNRDKIAAQRAAKREETNARQRARYHADIEVSRERNRIKARLDRARRKDEINAQRRARDDRRRNEINARRRARYARRKAVAG